MPTPSISTDRWQSVSKLFRWAYAGPVPVEVSRYRPFEHSGGWLILSGTATIQLKSGTFTAKRGQWMFPPPTDVREQHFAPKTRLLSVRFRCEWPDGQPIYTTGLPLILDGKEYPELRTAGLELATLCLTGGTTPAHSKPAALTVPQHLQLDAAFGRFLVLWAGALEAAQVQPEVRQPLDPRVAAALPLVARRDATFRDIAETVGLSVSQLNRLFIHHVKESPGAFRARKQKEEVCLQLQQTSLPVKVIAYQHGFRRLSHFSAWFKRCVGESPRDYRASRFVC